MKTVLLFTHGSPLPLGLFTSVVAKGFTPRSLHGGITDAALTTFKPEEIICVFDAQAVRAEVEIGEEPRKVFTKKEALIAFLDAA